MGAALTLIAVTGFNAVCLALDKLGTPRVFVIQLVFLYRYVFVLVDEAARMVRARSLRTFEGGGSGQNEIQHPPNAVEMAKTLARTITDNLGKQLKIDTRPPRHGNYHVLRETSLPAVIVECAFMSNEEQSKWMEDLAYTRLAAIAIFEGIMEACQSKKPADIAHAGEVQK